MRAARVVGLSADGTSVIVATDSGEELAIAADDRLRAALRGDRPRLGQLEIEMESVLSPREIQTRIRAGEELADVARVAGIPMDRVERFAAPVLAERDHIARQAMSSSVRRRGETSAARNLRTVVNDRLVGRGVDVASVEWDSFRLSDGRWAVTASYASGEAERQAQFAYDPLGPFLGRRQRRRPLDPGRPVPEQRTPAGSASTGGRGTRGGRLRTHLGSQRRTGPGSASSRRPATRRRSRPVRSRWSTAAGSPRSWSTIRRSRIRRRSRPTNPAHRTPRRRSRIGRTRPTSSPRNESERTVAAGDPGRSQDRPSPEAEPPPKSTRRKRASVPSWDEIMFGGPKTALARTGRSGAASSLLPLERQRLALTGVRHRSGHPLSVVASA